MIVAAPVMVSRQAGGKIVLSYVAAGNLRGRNGADERSAALENHQGSGPTEASCSDASASTGMSSAARCEPSR